MSDISERVSRGAKLLDEKRPGWVDELKAQPRGTALDMGDGLGCVLGRLYGEFCQGHEELLEAGCEDQVAMEFGFNLYADEFEAQDEEDSIYVEWGTCWCNEIASRE